MILSKSEAFIASVILALLAAGQRFITMAPWVHALLVAIFVFFAIVGVTAATPAQIAAKIPPHIAMIVGAFVSALAAFLQSGVSIPTVVSAVINAVLVLAAAMGIKVTTFTTSVAARRELAGTTPGVTSKPGVST